MRFCQFQQNNQVCLGVQLERICVLTLLFLGFISLNKKLNKSGNVVDVSAAAQDLKTLINGGGAAMAAVDELAKVSWLKLNFQYFRYFQRIKPARQSIN